MTTPTPRAGYCSETDVSVNVTELPPGMSVSSFVAKAADFMDSYIGQLYQLPLDLDPAHPGHFADIKLLSRINEYLATGTILRTLYGDKNGDGDHAYGKALYDEAKQELARIANGRTVIENAKLLSPTDDQPNGPLVTNRDAESFVDMFYSSKGTAHGGWRGYGIGITE
ncbi:head-to-tail adaptor [Rhodococcus phage Reynauld]|uniref:Head-to-tail adaptor n=1 Tax=Rhodococcus phage Reynauld TaxID=3062845 RepID=A0ACD4UHA9_9CAUD|nr:head-to-tail adaptor [Rhodococcus phage Reynauld]